MSRKPYIILVDDEDIILKSLRNEVKESFSKELYIEVAAHAEDALELIEELREEGAEIALIISDYIMPGKTGAEFLVEVHQKYPEIIKIMLTGQADLSGVQETVNKASLYRFITKPWNQSDLSLTIKEGLQSFAMRKELIARNQELLELNQSLEQKVVDRTKKLGTANDLLQSQKDQLEKLFDELNEKNDQISKSINYAWRIQKAVLGGIEENENRLGQSFIYFAPRDIVSGDFYYTAQKTENGQNKLFVAAADCTGHGVPGAFMSMIGQAQLNHVIHDQEIHDPGKILDLLDQNIFRDLNQELSFTHDGMDIALCCIDFEKRHILFAGAKRPLLLIHGSEVTEFKGTKFSVGGYLLKEKKVAFEQQVIPFPENGCTLYLFSDGLQDQFGGPEKRKFGIANLRQKLLSISSLPMPNQKAIIAELISDWMNTGNEKQIDDQLLIGITIPPLP